MQFRQHAVSASQPVNPLDILEQVITAESWPFERSCEDELNISVSGQWCDYQLTFNWREDLEALHLACAFDIKVPADKRVQIFELLASINEQMWIGHFDLWSEEGMLLFRHGVLMNGGAEVTTDQCEGLVRLAIEACERYFPAFQFVIWAGKTPQDAIASCMFDVEGHA